MKRVTPRSGVSEFGRKEIRKEGKVSIRRRGRPGTCVGSFAHANIQHPQAEEKGHGGTQNCSKSGSKGSLKESPVVIMKESGLNT